MDRYEDLVRGSAFAVCLFRGTAGDFELVDLGCPASVAELRRHTAERPHEFLGVSGWQLDGPHFSMVRALDEATTNALADAVGQYFANVIARTLGRTAKIVRH